MGNCHLLELFADGLVAQPFVERDGGGAGVEGHEGEASLAGEGFGGFDEGAADAAALGFGGDGDLPHFDLAIGQRDQDEAADEVFPVVAGEVEAGGLALEFVFREGEAERGAEDGEPELDALALWVPVTNTGDRAGKQVVQVYLSRVSESAVERPVLWLAGYVIVRSEPGTTTVATAEIEPRSLQYWSVDDHAWRTEPGTYAVHVGASVATLGDPLEFTV